MTSLKQVSHLIILKGCPPVKHLHLPMSNHLPRPPHRPRGSKRDGRERVVNTARSKCISIKNAKIRTAPAIHQVHESALCLWLITFTDQKWSPSVHMGESTALA